MSIPIPLFDGDSLEAPEGQAGSPGAPLALPGVALIQYTSGSTSDPKGACVTHANLIANANMLTRRFDADDTEVVVSWLPLFHDMGLMTGLVWPMVSGASSVLLQPSTFAARPATWPGALSRYRGTVSSGPTFAYQFCVDRVSSDEAAILDLSAWRIAICGAEPVRGPTMRAFSERFAGSGFDRCSLFPSYGLAEATLFVSGGPRSDGPKSLVVDAVALEQAGKVMPAVPDDASRELISCGVSADGVDIAIVDPVNFTRRPDGEVGEIWLRGPNICLGYLGLDEVNASVFQRPVGEAGPTYLRTGDLGVMTDNELFVVGRMKDILIVRGAKYAPQDLEATCAVSHPALEGVKGVAFALETEVECGVVVLHELRRGFDDQVEDIISSIRGDIARHHGLSVHAVGLLQRHSLPLTTSGKVRRQPTKEAWRAGELNVVSQWIAD